MGRVKALLVSVSLVLVFIGAEAQGQQGRIAGKVTDKSTGKPLAGINVVVEGTRLGAATGTEGNYKIENVRPGAYTIVASMMGYKKVSKSIGVSANEITRVNFKLSETAVKMKEVTVTAPGKVQILRKAPMTITVIDAAEIRGRAVSLNEVLNRATGVKIRREGGLGSADRIAIHGIEGKRIKVFIDGSPLNLPGGSFGINDLPIQLIERVEVYKGVVPARLGGDCIGGAVNVVLREFNSDYVDVNYSPGSYNTHRAAWVFKKVLDGPGIEFGTGGIFNYSDNDYLMESPFQPGLVIKRDHDAYLSYGGGIAMTLKKAWFDEIKIELEMYENRKEIQGVQKNIKFAETKSVIYVVPSISMKKEGFFLDNLDFDYSIGVPFFEGNFIDTSHYRYNWDGTKYPSPNGQGEVDWDPHNSKDKQYDVLQKLNLNYGINNVHSLNLNTVARYSSRHPDDSLAGTHAGYNVSEFPSEAYRVVTGLAHEMSLFDGITVNSLSAKLFHINSKIASTGLIERDLHGKPVTVKSSRTKFGISEAFRHRVFVPLIIKASCEHAVRLPDSRELFGDGVVITSSPNLKPEVSENTNLGMIFDQKGVFGIPRLEVEVNGFFRYTHDMIKLATSVLFSGHVNLGEVRTMGVDGEIRADITRNIYTYTNATYQDLRDVRDYVGGTTTPNPTKDLRVPNIPYFYCNFGVELHKEDLFGQGRFGKLFWESSYVEEFFYAWEMSDYQKRRIPSCFHQTVGIEYSFMDDGLILSAELHNLGDVKALDIYNRPRPGRTASVNLRYSWFRGKIEGSKHRVF